MPAALIFPTVQQILHFFVPLSPVGRQTILHPQDPFGDDKNCRSLRQRIISQARGRHPSTSPEKVGAKTGVHLRTGRQQIPFSAAAHRQVKLSVQKRFGRHRLPCALSCGRHNNFGTLRCTRQPCTDSSLPSVYLLLFKCMKGMIAHKGAVFNRLFYSSCICRLMRSMRSLFQPGNLCLRNPNLLCHLRLGPSRQKPQGQDPLFPLTARMASTRLISRSQSRSSLLSPPGPSHRWCLRRPNRPAHTVKPGPPPTPTPLTSTRFYSIRARRSARWSAPCQTRG